MSRTMISSALLAALLAWGVAAQADDLPGRVGRISSVQGEVTVAGASDPAAAMLNWPVTSGDHINTASGARAEFRVGAAAVRLDGDSDLEVTQLDDDNLRLRLNYGSASVRIRGQELLRDFELSTPQARVTMIVPGTVRVDAERQPDTSTVAVLAGQARVDGAGSQLVLDAGRRADVRSDEVRTGLAARDGFDSWAEARDRQDAAAIASRYVPTEITGYEELDRNGSWTDSVEYGPLWTPRVVAVDWAPYRDGQWVWMAWGWTWVDRAPWGYAPSHYGRWVMVNRRWCWAPGRYVARPLWAPALVGWVGADRIEQRNGYRGPALGWYPLAPHDRYVSPFRLSPEHERRLLWTHDGRTPLPLAVRDERNDWRRRHEGVTVVPREQFEGRHIVPVQRGPQVILPAPLLRTAPLATVAPPAAPVHTAGERRYDRGDGAWRASRQEHGGQNYAPPGAVLAPQPRGQQGAAPAQVLTAPPHQPGAPQAPRQQQMAAPLTQQAVPVAPAAPVPGRVIELRGEPPPAGVPANGERDVNRHGRGRYDDGRRQLRPEQDAEARPQPQAVVPQNSPPPAGQQQNAQQPRPAPQAAQREVYEREQARAAQLQREQGQREQAQREQREQSQREQVLRTQREQGQREQSQREQVQREQFQREQVQRAQHEQGQREQFQREQLQRAQHEQGQREQARAAAQQAQQAPHEQARPAPQAQPAQHEQRDAHPAAAEQQRREAAERRREEERNEKRQPGQQLR